VPRSGLSIPGESLFLPLFFVLSFLSHTFIPFAAVAWLPYRLTSGSGGRDRQRGTSAGGQGQEEEKRSRQEAGPQENAGSRRTGEASQSAGEGGLPLEASPRLPARRMVVVVVVRCNTQNWVQEIHGDFLILCALFAS
jgi:hypothetical protein